MSTIPEDLSTKTRCDQANQRPDAAARDLEELYDYIARHDSPERAGYVLEPIEQAVMTLAELPERGTHPKELQSLGSRE